MFLHFFLKRHPEGETLSKMLPNNSNYLSFGISVFNKVQLGVKAIAVSVSSEYGSDNSPYYQ